MVTILHITSEGTATDTKSLTDETMDTKDAMDKKNKKIADGSINEYVLQIFYSGSFTNIEKTEILRKSVRIL